MLSIDIYRQLGAHRHKWALRLVCVAGGLGRQVVSARAGRVGTAGTGIVQKTGEVERSARLFRRSGAIR